MANGFIKLDRNIEMWGWYKNVVVKTAWIHCLIKANWSECEFEGEKVMPGEFITSYEHFANETGLSVMQTRNALNKLQKSGEILLKTTNKFSKITVIKWEEYQSQSSELTNKQQSNNNQITNKQQQYKNIKNIKNIEEDIGKILNG